MIKHHMSRTRTYKSWAEMKYRCGNIHRPNYLNISYDKKWESFEQFYKDMGDRPLEHSLDRIDTSKGYSKENCRWADNITQQNNRSNNNKLEFNGKKQTLSMWARELGIKRSTLAQRYYVMKWDVEKTLTYRKGE